MLKLDHPTPGKTNDKTPASHTRDADTENTVCTVRAKKTSSLGGRVSY